MFSLETVSVMDILVYMGQFLQSILRTKLYFRGENMVSVARAKY